MNEQLFPYQIEGAQILARQQYHLLADEMGLGKSAQAIVAADDLAVQKIIVLCPAVGTVNWLREFDKFSVYRRRSKVYDGHPVDGEVELLVSSYGMAMLHPGGIRQWCERANARPGVLILDESHFLKSIDAKRTVGIYGKSGLVRLVDRVWLLSGTPMPNHPGEMWAMLYTFGRTPLSYDDFLARYCTGYTYQRRFQVTGAKADRIPELKQLLKGFMTRRLKKDVMRDLPPIVFHDIVVPAGFVDLDICATFMQWVFPHDRRGELDAEMAKQRALVDHAMGLMGTRRDGMKTLEAIKDSIATLRRYTGLQKVEPVAQLLFDELLCNAYDKIVVFAIHRDVIEQLRVALQRFKPVTLYGGTDPGTRQRNVDKFMNNPKCRVFIGNIQAAGTNITLTSAAEVMFIEQDWVPGNNAQAAMRVHRIGQTRPVRVRAVGMADSFDEKISHALKVKTMQIVRVFDEEETEA